MSNHFKSEAEHFEQYDLWTLRRGVAQCGMVWCVVVWCSVVWFGLENCRVGWHDVAWFVLV